MQVGLHQPEERAAPASPLPESDSSARALMGQVLRVGSVRTTSTAVAYPYNIIIYVGDNKSHCGSVLG
jgi:hypothetical protein